MGFKMKIHHIGYLTKNLSKTQQQMQELGFAVEQESSYDAGRAVNIAFLVSGNYRIELIEPASKESPLYPLLKRYKNTPYHICYEVPNLSDALAEYEQKGYSVIQQPQEAPCIGQHKVAFLMHINVGMIELLEI